MYWTRYIKGTTTSQYLRHPSIMPAVLLVLTSADKTHTGRPTVRESSNNNVCGAICCRVGIYPKLPTLTMFLDPTPKSISPPQRGRTHQSTKEALRSGTYQMPI